MIVYHHLNTPQEPGQFDPAARNLSKPASKKSLQKSVSRPKHRFGKNGGLLASRISPIELPLFPHAKPNREAA